MESVSVSIADMADGYNVVDEGMLLNEGRSRELGWDGMRMEALGVVRRAIEKTRKFRGEGKGVMPLVRVYRAVPVGVKEGSLRNGDWVTPVRAYAKEHGESHIKGKVRIIEQMVPVDCLYWNGDDVCEWGYDDGESYAYRNTKNNRKLLSPVTYELVEVRDEGGEYEGKEFEGWDEEHRPVYRAYRYNRERRVVPLSKRFDYRRDDVSFAVREGLEEDVKAACENRLKSRDMVELCSCPPVLIALGQKEMNVVTMAHVLRKVAMKHKMGVEDVVEVVRRLGDPELVIQDGVDSFIFIPGVMGVNRGGGESDVEVPLKVEHTKDGEHYVLSAYPLDSLQKIENKLREGKLVYSKRSLEEMKEAMGSANGAPGLSPELVRLAVAHGFSEDTITEEDVVKRGREVRGVDFGVRDWYVADMRREMERSRSDAVREYWGHVVERVESEGRTLEGMLNGRVGEDDVRVRVAEARSIMKVAIGTLPEGVRGKLAGQERLLDYLVGVMSSGRLGESGMLGEAEREELNRRLELDPGMLDGLVGSSVERLLGKVYRRCGEVWGGDRVVCEGYVVGGGEGVDKGV